MEAKIENDKDANSVPYSELKTAPSFEDNGEDNYFITFRKYPKRVFVGVEDYRGDQSSGLDLEECWLAPVYIIQKTPKEEFKPYDAFINALRYLGLIEDEYDALYYQDKYVEIESVVEAWRKSWTG